MSLKIAASIFLAALSITSCNAFATLRPRVAAHSIQQINFDTTPAPNAYPKLNSPIQKTKLFAAGTVADDMDVRASDDGKQGLALSTFNLVKACVGSGVLALSAGVGAIGDVSSALYPATLLIFVLGALSAYSFHMIGRFSHMDGPEKSTKSLSAAWEKEVGEESSWIVSLACFLTPLGATLTYSIILGDMLSALAHFFGVKGLLATRHASILGITALALYPLVQLKSLAALAPVSMIGVSGMVLTSIFMLLTAITGAYGPESAYVGSLTSSLRPSFGIIGNTALSPSILILVSMAATSYLAHFTAHEFYDGLKNSSHKKFGLLTGIGFAITALMNTLVMSAGFLTFGGNSQGMILNNYSPKDIGATICRFIVTISLVGSYPIFMRGIKSAYFELFQKGKEVTDGMNKKATNGFLAGITALALVLEDAGFMVSLTGAVMGSAIIYVFPSIIFLKMTSRLMAAGKLKKTKAVTAERIANKFLIGTGVILGVLGASVTVSNTFFPSVL